MRRLNAQIKNIFNLSQDKIDHINNQINSIKYKKIEDSSNSNKSSKASLSEEIIAQFQTLDFMWYEEFRENGIDITDDQQRFEFINSLIPRSKRLFYVELENDENKVKYGIIVDEESSLEFAQKFSGTFDENVGCVMYYILKNLA